MEALDRPAIANERFKAARHYEETLNNMSLIIVLLHIDTVMHFYQSTCRQV